jgi:SAM-dependent methyltransferase
MSSLLDVARASLSAPAVYDLYQRLVGAPAMIDRFVSDYIRPSSGQRLLDVGCGTGAVVPHIPEEVELVGIDISERYIRAAAERHGERGSFRCADASELSIELGDAFDTAFATGVLHHMPDAPARRLVEGALARLKSGGRFVAIDPTLVKGQGWVSRTIVKSDRGEFIRSPEEMADLLAGLGARFEVVSDMLNIPFAQVITTIETV